LTEDATVMINAVRLRRELAVEITKMHSEMQQQSGFEALATSAAMLALTRMMVAIGNATPAEEREREEYERLRRKFG
jgi:predicted kinase